MLLAWTDLPFSLRRDKNEDFLGGRGEEVDAAGCWLRDKTEYMLIRVTSSMRP